MRKSNQASLSAGFLKPAVLLLLVPVFLAMGMTVSRAADCDSGLRCHQVLVKFSRRLHPSDIADILQSHGAKVLRHFPRTHIDLLSLPPSGDTLQQIQDLKDSAGVLMAIPNQSVSAQALPNDPKLNLQWGLKNQGQGGGTIGNDIGIESVWDEFQDTGEIIVAVIDSGVDWEHPDLALNMWVNPGEIPDNHLDDDGDGYIDDVHGYDFINGDGDPMDDYKHGTHVAGILGAVGNNAVGVSGVAWHAKIMALKFLDEGGNGDIANAIPAIEFALDHGAKILVNSWGDSSFNPALFNAVLEADTQGVLFFASAGNQSRDTDEEPFYPADYDSPNVVSLASIDSDDRLSPFSNYGRLSVDLAAPGGGIFSTLPEGSYGYISGTSMAVPYAAGAAAVLWSRFPDLTHRQVRNLLLQGSASRAYLNGKNLMGGVLDVAGALAVARDSDNQFPIANAGPDQVLELGTRIPLLGSATDPDGDSPLIYEWELQVPSGSLSRLDSRFDLSPSFVPDREGIYIATLQVGDSHASGIPDSVKLTIAGGQLPPPVPVIKAWKRIEGLLQSLDPEVGVPLGASVEVDAGDSESLFPENLLFEWALIEKPAGSHVSLSPVDRADIAFTPDLPGLYTLRLNLEDGYQENRADFSFLVVWSNLGSPDGQSPTDAGPPFSSAAGGCSLQTDFRGNH